MSLKKPTKNKENMLETAVSCTWITKCIGLPILKMMTVQTHFLVLSQLSSIAVIHSDLII